jgi:hypothetical protein
MIAKYISASLLTVSRILGAFIPRYVDLMTCVCTMTITKTARSKGRDRWFNWRNWGIRKSDDMLTKGERDDHLNDCPGSFKFAST